jgi:hypothetical protein
MDCINLKSVRILSATTELKPNCFKNCYKLTIYCYRNSKAHIYAINNNIKYKFIN